MKQVFSFLTLSAICFTTGAFAHGHGGGSHGGGHAHSHAAGSHTSSANNSSTHTQASSAKPKRNATVITRSTSPAAIAASHARRASSSATATSVTAAPHPGRPVAGPHSAASATSTAATTYSAPSYFENNNNGYGQYGYYGSPYGYYYSPYFYDPYYSPFMFYYGFMYTPNYYPISSPAYAGGNNDEVSRQPMDGFVVFYHDTLSGAVTVNRKAISMETTDSGKDYDYRFREKDPGLQYVTVYNDDDKQLNLVRLKGDTKKLWRVIHTGKLNIYDGHRGFLYKPEDVDLKTLTVSVNGSIESLNSSSVSATKEWLTKYVNEAYGSNLNPKDFTWKQLLIYIDKLD